MTSLETYMDALMLWPTGTVNVTHIVSHDEWTNPRISYQTVE